MAPADEVAIVGALVEACGSDPVSRAKLRGVPLSSEDHAEARTPAANAHLLL